MANFVSYENATTLVERIEEKFDAIDNRGAYTYRGSITFANLPSTLTKAMTGYTYNLTEEFTTDSRFIEGAGKKYPAGTNVTVANTGTDQTPVMKFDVNGSFYDIDAVEERIDAVVANLADAFDETEAYAAGDVVIYNDELYKFTDAKAAGAWDSSVVELTTVKDLIDASEPDSLTTSQINALLALLD